MNRKHVAMDILLETGETRLSRSKNSIVWNIPGIRADDYSDTAFNKAGISPEKLTKHLTDEQIEKYETSEKFHQRQQSRKGRIIFYPLGRSGVCGLRRICVFNGFEQIIIIFKCKKKCVPTTNDEYRDYVNKEIFRIAAKYQVVPNGIKQWEGYSV